MKNISKIYMIFGITLLVIAVVGSTLAYYVWTTSENQETKIVTEIGAVKVYFDGEDSIEDTSLRPVSDKNKGIIKTINVKASTTGIKLNLYLDLISLPDTLKEESFKYVFYNDSTVIKEGNFSSTSITSDTSDCTINNTKHITLLDNVLTSTSTTSYQLYIWVDGANYENPITMMGQSFNFKLHADGTGAVIQEGKIPDITETISNSLANKLVSTYISSEKITVTNNGIAYYYDETNHLMSDVNGNLRYYGANPNNYVYFNCSDYANQSSSTCELWRIIGVFEGKIKLIRNTSIGSYSWDNKDTSTGALEDGGKSDWTDARLMKLLNPGYESEIVGGSLYYNAGSGTCYSGANNATIECNFTTIGIKNDTTRNLILEVVYYLGGMFGSNVYPDFIYEKERGTSVYTGWPTKWIGKIGLMYPSDYGYAADFTKCKDASGNDFKLNSYNSDANDYQCRKNNYLYKGSEWLLTTSTWPSFHAWYVNAPGQVNYDNKTYVSTAIRPTIFLSTTQEIVTGNGSSSNPYQLKVS